LCVCVLRENFFFGNGCLGSFLDEERGELRYCNVNCKSTRFIEFLNAQSASRVLTGLERCPPLSVVCMCVKGKFFFALYKQKNFFIKKLIGLQKGGPEYEQRVFILLSFPSSFFISFFLSFFLYYFFSYFLIFLSLP